MLDKVIIYSDYDMRYSESIYINGTVYHEDIPSNLSRENCRGDYAYFYKLLKQYPDYTLIVCDDGFIDVYVLENDEVKLIIYWKEEIRLI